MCRFHAANAALNILQGQLISLVQQTMSLEYPYNIFEPMKVTIGIPVFNCETWVANAIQSALEQTWPDKEIIVVDDGSTDRSGDICKSFGSRILFVQ
jgi:cellulose synthase/poly-beta-1,6-N-acetylglucosamine synthase-like glycosyltransferase